MSSGEVCVMGQHAAAWHLQQKIGILFGRVTMQHGHAATLGKESRTWAPHHRCSWSHPPPTTNHLRGRINTLLRQLGLDSAALADSPRIGGRRSRARHLAGLARCLVGLDQGYCL